MSGPQFRSERSHPALDVIPSRTPDQFAFVVHDLPAAVDSWSAILGSEDWRVYTYGPQNVLDLKYRGEPAAFSMRLALCGTDPQVELIEILQGPSSYTEWMERHGPGLQHIGYFVPSITETMERISAMGLVAVQSGRGYGLDGDGGFAYYEIPGIDTIVEFIEVPARRRPSEELTPTPIEEI
jgi:methylmalonyl-CoA/ethylmalonyl-CoA epimerase